MSIINIDFAARIKAAQGIKPTFCNTAAPRDIASERTRREKLQRAQEWLATRRAYAPVPPDAA